MIHFTNEISLINNAVSSCELAQLKCQSIFPEVIFCRIILCDSSSDSDIKKLKEVYPDWEIIYVEFESLANSKNYIASHIQDGYITFLDADDQMSSNWLLAALSRFRSILTHEDLILRPTLINYKDTSKDSEVLIHMNPCLLSKKVLLKRISLENIWINAYFTKIDTLKNLTYGSSSHGIHWEDWEWNIKLLVNNIKQELVPKTFWVVYKRPKSLSTSHIISDRALSMISRSQLPKLKKRKKFLIQMSEILLALFLKSKLIQKFASNLLKFDAQFYAQVNKDLTSYSRLLLIHYLLYGRHEGRMGSENVFKKSELPISANVILVPRRVLGLSLGSFYNLN